MAIMYPKNINEYLPTASEKIVYEKLQKQLPDTYEVFYSVEWSRDVKGKMEKSEADFIVTHPSYGFICLEVKGGSRIFIDNNVWYLEDLKYGTRKLKRSPYEQAEESMYYFKDLYRQMVNLSYNGIFAAGSVFPFFNIASISTQISDRQASCTIDATKMNDLHSAIKAMFKSWGGSKYGLSMYSKSEHKALLELIKKRIAISAAAGALVEYKEKQLDGINRVQDNYIHFIANYRQFYMRGGAGTGKTWIAMKMAKQESSLEKTVLITCASKPLSIFIKEYVGDNIDVYDISTLLEKIIDDYETIDKETYDGVLSHLKTNAKKYDSIFIDEAQDLCEEVACVLKMLLKDEKTSTLGVFYDDVQKLREDSFGDVFMIDTPAFLLRENIRNTSNIYNYAMENTNLGRDVIRNLVEGPIPMKEKINDKKHLTQRLGNLLKEFIVDEALNNNSIVILFDDIEEASTYIENGLAQWKFVLHKPNFNNEIQVSSAFDFKGLESDMVIYVHKSDSSKHVNYIAYTRAKYYLYELVR